MQLELLTAQSLAPTVSVPSAPELQLRNDWIFPGYTPRECAQASMARSDQYLDMLAAVIKSQGGVQLSDAGVMALIPSDWRKVMGKYLHATMVEWQCKPRGIELSYLMPPNGFPIYMYQPSGC